MAKRRKWLVSTGPVVWHVVSVLALIFAAGEGGSAEKRGLV